MELFGLLSINEKTGRSGRQILLNAGDTASLNFKTKEPVWTPWN